MLTEHIERFKLYKRHKRVPLSKIHLMMQKTTIRYNLLTPHIIIL